MIDMKNIMKRAHELTKEIKGEYPEVDYKTQLGICLSFLSKKGDNDMTIEEKLNKMGFKTWKKGDKKRVYINSLADILEKTGLSSNPKAYRKDSMYYDVVLDKFFSTVSSSAKETVESIIKYLKEEK